MRKEIIVAIIIGLFLGLIVAYGIRSAQISLENRQTTTQKAASNSQQATSQVTPAHTVFITTPEPNTVTDKDSVAIIGTTSPESLISIINETDHIATIADETGNFTGTIDLSGGVNSIAIKSYNNQGEIAETSFMIIYSTADLTATSSATDQTKE